MLFRSHLRSALHNELDRFFRQFPNDQAPTASAFSQARSKLLPSAFVSLLQMIVARYYETTPHVKWYGLRLLAIDGSTLRLDGVSASCRDYFDPEAAIEQRCGLARVSVCFDVANRLPIDATIAPYRVRERALAVGHFDHCNSGDLLLMDRGYPSFWLFSELIHRDVQFCIRVSPAKWTSILGRFMHSDDDDSVVKIVPNSKMRRECHDRSLPEETIALRAVKVRLNTGEVEVLLTNLFDRAKWPTSGFGELYHQRWIAEEGYKLEKSRLELERWSGKSIRAVEQDFYGRMLLATLSACLATVAEPLVAEATKKCKHRYQVNQTRALGILRNQISALLLLAKLRPRLKRLIQEMCISPTVVRPGRVFPRPIPEMPRRFHMAYKPIP